MREAISDLNRRFGCRIFVIALGDRKKVYADGKVGVWAATLDEPARELNVVIIVSAGNRQPRGGLRIEEAVTHFPTYLLEADNRLCEPAGAMNVVTVGAIAHGNGLSPALAANVGVQPITDIYHPSPFTRVGPGLAGAIKPDFIDFGGTLIYDAGVARIRGGEDVPEAGIMSLYHHPIDQLFTFASGTSYSPPPGGLQSQPGISHLSGRVRQSYRPTDLVVEILANFGNVQRTSAAPGVPMR